MTSSTAKRFYEPSQAQNKVIINRFTNDIDGSSMQVGSGKAGCNLLFYGFQRLSEFYSGLSDVWRLDICDAY